MTATWIREGRLSKGLTQKELSERSNISVRSIQRIENGTIVPRSHTLKTLAGILDLPFEEFIQTARSQHIFIQDGEEDLSAGLTRPQRFILSGGICLSILFLAWAFIAQSAHFPETSFEFLVFCATILGLITVVLVFVWRKNS